MRSAEAPSTHPHRQLRELGSCGMASCKWVTANNDDWVRGTMTGEGASGDGQGGPQGAHQGDLQGGQVRHPSALYLPMCSTPYTALHPPLRSRCYGRSWTTLAPSVHIGRAWEPAFPVLMTPVVLGCQLVAH